MLSFWEVAEKLKNGFKEIHSLSLSDLSHLDTEQVNEVSEIWKKLSHKTKDNLFSSASVAKRPKATIDAIFTLFE